MERYSASEQETEAIGREMAQRLAPGAVVAFTGDLGAVGHDIVVELFRREGVELAHYTDCGLLLYDRKAQDMHAGGSGCGCSAAVLNGMVLEGMPRG